MEEPFASMMMVWVIQRSLGFIVVLEVLFGFGGAHALVEEDIPYVEKQAKEIVIYGMLITKLALFLSPFIYIFMP